MKFIKAFFGLVVIGIIIQMVMFVIHWNDGKVTNSISDKDWIVSNEKWTALVGNDNGEKRMVVKMTPTRDVYSTLVKSEYEKCADKIAEAESKSNGYVEFYGDTLDFGVLAKTLYMEARGEGEKGMRAVASVIYNRMMQKKKTAKEICFAKFQFSCWNKTDKDNCRIIKCKVDKQFMMCLKIALEFKSGKFVPSVNANHYYNPKLCNPNWGSKMRDVVVIGNHRFGTL